MHHLRCPSVIEGAPDQLRVLAPDEGSSCRPAEPRDELPPSHRSFLLATVPAVGYRGLGCVGTGVVSRWRATSLDLFCSAEDRFWHLVLFAAVHKFLTQ